jgi:hypothetical protein
MGGMMVDRIQLWLERLAEKEILVPDGSGYRLAQTTHYE